MADIKGKNRARSTEDSAKPSPSKPKRRDQPTAEGSEVEEPKKKKVRIETPDRERGGGGSRGSIDEDAEPERVEKIKTKRGSKKQIALPEKPFVIPTGSKDTFKYTYPPKQGPYMEAAPPCLLAYSKTAHKDLDSKLTIATPVISVDDDTKNTERLKVFSCAQKHEIILQMSRDPRSTKLKQYLTHYAGLRPCTPETLPRVSKSVPLGASDPPNLQYGRDGTSHFIDWHDAESSSSPWVLVKKELGSGDDRKRYHKGIIEAAAHGIFGERVLCSISFWA